MAKGIEKSQEVQRQTVLAYLCKVSPIHVKEKWSVSEATIISNFLKKYSFEWDDPLVEFYRLNSGNRGKNATHLYLSFKGQDMPHKNLIDLERDKRVYEAVYDDVFNPFNEETIRQTNLERIFTEPKKKLSAEEKLIIKTFGGSWFDSERRLKRFFMPMLYDKLKEAYNGDKRVNLKKIYDHIGEEIFTKLREGLELATNSEVVEYAKSLEDEKKNRLGEKTREVLNSLTPREEKVLKMRFGIGEGEDYSLEKVGRDFNVTRERIRQIEAKGIRKLRHPSRSRKFKSFLYMNNGCEDSSKYSSVKDSYQENGLKNEIILDMPISDFELGVRSQNCMKNMGIITLRDLVQKTERDLLRTMNFGTKSLREVNDFLEKRGLHLGMKLDDNQG